MEVTIKTLEPMRVGALRHVGPYSEIGAVYGQLGRIVGLAGLFGRPGVFMLGLYHDDPDRVPAAELRADAAVALPEGVPVPDGLTEIVTLGGRYACAVYEGPYQGLPDAWHRFVGGWLPDSGEQWGDGPSQEIYLNDASQVQPEQLRTELRIRLA